MTYTPTLSRRAALGLIAAVPVTLASPLILRSASAATPKVYAEDGIAIDGTDAVAYRTEGAPTPGSADFAFDWNGATWHFSSAETREMFISGPEYYAPAYGGYCAFAVSQGYTASTVPEAWTIHDDRLFLNFSRRIQRRWARDIPGNVVKGDANWPGVLA